MLTIKQTAASHHWPARGFMSSLAWMKGAGRTVGDVKPHTLRAVMVDSERPQPQTELVICSVVWQSVPPLTLTLYLHGHNDRLCWAVALPLFSISLLLLFKFWFATRLSSPPSFFFLVRSDCPTFLTFQLRMLEIPSSCCGLAKPLLFHPSILRPFLTYPPVHIWSAPDEDGRTGRDCCHDHLHLRSRFLPSAFFQKGSQPCDGPRRDLEMSFYMYSNSAKKEITHSPTHTHTHTLERAYRGLRTLWLWQGGKEIGKTLQLNRQDVRVKEKWLRQRVNRRVWMNTLLTF